MRRRTLSIVAAIALVSIGLSARQGTDRLTADLLKGLELRTIGPALTTGRIVDVKIDPRNPSVWYVVSAFGGLWKTTNRGVTFSPIFDDNGVFTLCCIAIDPKDSNVLWLGTGENNSQRSAHFGDGVYKSLDAGKTWKRVGLETSEHIGDILIDPRNSSVVYVASQGPLFSEGGERGLYKTTDGGATWTAALTISKDTGISDIVFDPRNPDVIFASAYQRRRHVGQMIGGGPEGGIFKSTNGGKSWTKLTKGLPAGEMGRAGLAIDGKKNPSTVFALVDAKRPESGFFRSDDGGNSWTRIGRMIGGGRGGAGGGAGRGAAPGAPAANAPAPPAPCAPLGGPSKTAPSGPPGDVVAASTAAAPPRSGEIELREEEEEEEEQQEQFGGRGGAPTDDCYRGGGAQVLPRDLRGPVPRRLDLVDERQRRAQHRRRQDVADDGHRGHRRPRRSSCDRVRSDRPQSHRARERRRALRIVRRGRDVALLRQPADHAVLSPLGRQRQAVLQHLRRHAGQLLVLRSLPEHEPARRADERLVHRQRRRRIPVEKRSRRSEHRLRVVAERRHRAPRQADGHQPIDPAAGHADLRRRRRRRDAGRAAAGARR